MSKDITPRTVTNFSRSDAYRAEVHRLIPGGPHTYSRGDDQFPALAPAAIARGKGARVWDVDGNEYVDCTMALGSINLGYAYGPVLEAVRAQIELGSGFQRPAAIELEFAREFLAAIPGADRVKFAKNGSTVTRIGRFHRINPTSTSCPAAISTPFTASSSWPDTLICTKPRPASPFRTLTITW